MRDHVAICFEKFSRSRAVGAALALCVGAGIVSCSESARPDPTDIATRDVTLDGEHPAVFTRALQRGVYLVEARERDIDVRVAVEVPGSRTTLEGRPPRHGVVYKVVSLAAPGELRVVVSSTDHRTRHGTVALRLARWSRTPEQHPGELEAGFAAQSAAA